MQKKTKFITFFTFATLVYFIILCTLGYLGAQYFRSQKRALSNILLLESQNSGNISLKILFSRASNLLNSSDQAGFETFLAADKLGNKYLAESAANSLSNIATLDALGGSAFKNFEFLYKQGYPQVASKYIISKLDTENFQRNELIQISSVLEEQMKVEAAYTTLVKAKEIDPYYPQTYKQLITVCEKLYKLEEKAKYEELYRAFAW